MTAFDAKLLHFTLNLNYKQKNITIENQTNQLINFIMNDFLKQYREQLSDKYVVLEFQNDEFSLLAYNILKAIQAIVPFSLLIYNKNKKLKEFLNTKEKKKGEKKKKEKRISNFSFNRLLSKDKVIFISCYNPIYQVANVEKVFKILDCCYYLLNKFTPEQFKMAFDFYGIPIFDNHFINNSKVSAFSDFCNGIKNNFFDYEALSKQLKIPEEIYILKMTGDNEKDNDIVNEIVDEDAPVFYACENKEYPMLSSAYQYFLKNKSNICDYWNKNSFEIAKEFQARYNCKVNFIGDFSEKEKEAWLNV